MSSPNDRPRRHGHPIHLRLDDDQLSTLSAFSDARGLTLTAALRLAVARLADGEADIGGQVRSLTHVAVGSLVAAEHARLVVEKLLGRHAIELLGGLDVEAAAAARRRLIELEGAYGSTGGEAVE